MSLLLSLLVALPALCFGLESGNLITGRIRDRWGPESGFPPGPVYAISQAKDGYLWIGTEQGLVRFDGQSFRLTGNSDPDQPIRPVIGLTPVANGDLWVRPRRPSLLRFRRGTFDNPMAAFGRPKATVAAASQTSDGALLVWILKGEPTAAVLKGERFETIS
ncbi:MAG TPA: two-component regulator propeller domain-containing protein, partial [Bryobacteraceae bacterium]|nr:two-component regulator propeller domain-containing protein [Bryobacteraceae bacterium]